MASGEPGGAGHGHADPSRRRAGGLAAVRRWSAELDGWSPPDLRVGAREIAAAADALDPVLRDHIDFALDQVRGFARQRATLTDLEVETLPGVVLGHRHLPIEAVGSYSPGRRYPLIASSVMTVAVPNVAGVERVVAWQALAAMAFGIEGLVPVHFIVGAGNSYVAEAKRQLFGPVGIDLLAGPTEVLVLVDDTADAEVVAVDLLGQAEHGPDSPAIAVCRSEAFGRAVLDAVERRLAIGRRQRSRARRGVR